MEGPRDQHLHQEWQEPLEERLQLGHPLPRQRQSHVGSTAVNKASPVPRIGRRLPVKTSNFKSSRTPALSITAITADYSSHALTHAFLLEFARPPLRSPHPSLDLLYIDFMPYSCLICLHPPHHHHHKHTPFFSRPPQDLKSSNRGCARLGSGVPPPLSGWLKKKGPSWLSSSVDIAAPLAPRCAGPWMIHPSFRFPRRGHLLTEPTKKYLPRRGHLATEPTSTPPHFTREMNA